MRVLVGCPFELVWVVMTAGAMAAGICKRTVVGLSLVIVNVMILPSAVNCVVVRTSELPRSPIKLTAMIALVYLHLEAS